GGSRNVAFEAGASRRVHPAVSTASESPQALAIVGSRVRPHARTVSATATVEASAGDDMATAPGRRLTRPPAPDPTRIDRPGRERDNGARWPRATPGRSRDRRG